MTSMAGETVDLVEPWLYATLSGDATLLGLIGGLTHLSGTLSIEELPLPYVTMAFVSARDIQGNAGSIIAVESIYQVKAVDATASWDDVIPIASRITTLLHRPGQVVTLTGGSLTIVRERILQYPEVTDGVQYRHLGAQWRIRASRDA